jgi:hypothetical protein
LENALALKIFHDTKRCGQDLLEDRQTSTRWRMATTGKLLAQNTAEVGKVYGGGTGKPRVVESNRMPTLLSATDDVIRNLDNKKSFNVTCG